MLKKALDTVSVKLKEIVKAQLPCKKPQRPNLAPLKHSRPVGALKIHKFLKSIEKPKIKKETIKKLSQDETSRLKIYVEENIPWSRIASWLDRPAAYLY